MSKIELNDHLDDMMERLMNEDLSPDELKLEVERSKALCNLADKKLTDKKIMADVMIAIGDGKVDGRFIPNEFSGMNQLTSQPSQGNNPVKS